jgi:glycine cleavage system pyridoxal-binding protein P
VLEHCAEYRALLFPVHFGAPHVGAITAVADAFSLRFVPGREL